MSTYEILDFLYFEMSVRYKRNNIVMDPVPQTHHSHPDIITQTLVRCVNRIWRRLQSNKSHNVFVALAQEMLPFVCEVQAFPVRNASNSVNLSRLIHIIYVISHMSHLTVTTLYLTQTIEYKIYITYSWSQTHKVSPHNKVKVGTQAVNILQVHTCNIVNM